MIQSIIYSMILTSSFIFMQMNHPLAMGLTLLVQTILISLITGLLTKSFWFSYILFLIFMGGMLVLFIYVTSLASNEMFSLSMKLSIVSMMMFSSYILILLFLLDDSLMNLLFKNNEMNSIMYLNSSIDQTLNMNKLYNYPTNMITIMLINYLFITLIVVVKVTKLFFGPIRVMN
uniref:NADH dehydrogenase subunit 6 n=1 Tax=Verrallia virginica TaxID=115334 RepID=UPI0026E41BCB|nr:NADH dehydrogenase subunit 6 [Verrallia virginica]WJW73902.1 NADH dehydrogenase subunit 6 [Verrallia virginica]